jgi:hypothetical protein
VILPQNRDKPLSFHWQAALPLDALCLLPTNKKKASMQAAILLDVILEAHGAGRCISYSRSPNFYAMPKRYQGIPYSFAVVGIIDELVRLGWLYTVIAANKGPSGRQSTVWATPALLEAVALPVQVQFVPGDTIRLKNAEKQLIDYRDTERVCRMRRRLDGINEGLAAQDITLPGATVRGNHMIFERDNGRVVANTSRNQLFRSFNNGSWGQGGRFYGHYVQNIPSDERKQLLIDGEPTLEADFSAIHAHLAYAEAGAQLDGDPYDVDGFERAEGKITFQIALNALNERQAVGAIAEHVFGGREHPWILAKACLDAVKARNPRIAHIFHTGAGLRYQNLDAAIMERVQLDMSKRGITVTPIHDSAITQAQYIDILQEIMAKAAAMAGVGNMPVEIKH